MRGKNQDRDAKILKMRHRKSYGLIAKELGISRNIVAGVCFRADWPAEIRVNNKSGTGYKSGQVAPKNLVTKLTSEKVRQIRLLRATEVTSYRKLAIKFGVSQLAVYYAALGRTWRHVKNTA
jgi:DNA invertase Pin-like site-specific DNA recombinase